MLWFFFDKEVNEVFFFKIFSRELSSKFSFEEVWESEEKRRRRSIFLDILEGFRNCRLFFFFDLDIGLLDLN